MCPCPTLKCWSAQPSPEKMISSRPQKPLYRQPHLENDFCEMYDALCSPGWGMMKLGDISMKKVEMPKMGDSMEEGKILHWIKKEGDPVKKGEMLAEVETDKVNIEIEAFASGVLRKILVPEGTSAPVGAEIALIGAADEPLPGELSGKGAGVATGRGQAIAPTMDDPFDTQENAARAATGQAIAPAIDDLDRRLGKHSRGDG